jgi:hypothetical protein
LVVVEVEDIQQQDQTRLRTLAAQAVQDSQQILVAHRPPMLAEAAVADV